MIRCAALLAGTIAFAQTRVEVPLCINSRDISFSASVDFPGERDVLANRGELRVGRAPGGVRVAVEALPDGPLGYSIVVDTNVDGVLDEPVRFIQPGGELDVIVDREHAKLPYRIELHRTVRGGAAFEWLSWTAKYRAEGRLKTGTCDLLVALADLRGDGVFDRRDLFHGSAFGIDTNDDGVIFGRPEYLGGERLFSVCGKTLRIDSDSIAPDGSKLTLIEEAVPIPKVGSPLPPISFRDHRGRMLSNTDLEGKPVLLDFWASWCGPCVATLPKLKESYNGNFHLISINVDEPDELANVKSLTESFGLPWPQVINGQGMADPLWRQFGSMEESHMGIPFYVAADASGVIRYAGADLEAARAALNW